MKNQRIARKPRFSHQYSQQAVIEIVKRREEKKVRKRTNKRDILYYGGEDKEHFYA